MRTGIGQLQFNVVTAEVAPAVLLNIRKQSGTNTIQISDAVQAGFADAIVGHVNGQTSGRTACAVNG